MPRLIDRPTIVQAAGNKPKQIEEYAGRVNSGHAGVSVARIAGRVPDVAIWPTLTLEDAAALARRNAEEITALVASVTEDDLAREIEYRNSAGQQFRTRLEDILLHVALHGSYHRGQVSLVIRAGGGEPAPTDYIAFIRGAPAARTPPPIPLAQPR